MKTENLLKNISKEELFEIVQNKVNQRYNLMMFDFIDWLSISRPHLKSLLEMEAYEQCAVMRDEYESEIKKLIPFVLEIDSIVRYTSEEWVEQCLRKVTKLVDIAVTKEIITEPNVETTEDILFDFLKWANETTIEAATIYTNNPLDERLNKFKDLGFIKKETPKTKLIKILETT